MQDAGSTGNQGAGLWSFAGAIHSILLASLVVFAAAACSNFSDPAVQTFSSQSATTLISRAPTYQVRRGTIAGQIDLRGQVVAVHEAHLFFKTDGWVKDIKVNLGDQVGKGSIVAEMESPSLDDNVQEAKYRLDIASLNLAYNNEPSAVDKVALAQAKVDQATVALERARLSLAKLVAPPTPEEVEASKLAVERAKNNLWAIQEERDGIKGSRSSPEYQGKAADARVAVAENLVRAAQLELEFKQKGPKLEDVALAQNEVATGEANLAAARANLEYEKAAKDLDTATLQSDVRRREQLLQIASKRLNETRLAAPFAGMIVSLDAKAGDAVKPFSPIAILADTSLLQIETDMSDEQVDNIAIGMPAVIGLDGIQGKTFTGKVTSIADKPTTWQGKSLRHATIAFDAGTNASVPMRVGSDITVAGKTKKNVLLVPKESLTQDGDRQYVQLIVNGKETRTAVKTGVSSADWVEIIGGISEGEQIAIPLATDSQTQAK